MKLKAENLTYLQNSYLTHFPSEFPTEILQDYKAIVEYQRFIRSLIPNKRILNDLLDITIEKIVSKKRFQRINFIKLIYSQINTEFVDSKLSEKLFFIFQSLITIVNDDIKWKLSVTIKDIELSQKNIDWLIENWEKSEHIQNRLLRYPAINKQITKWGKSCLINSQLENRLSELIGLQLNIDNSFSVKEKTPLLWGIHYSKLDMVTKKKLLIKHMNNENFSELMKICEKNNFTDLISQLYHEFAITQ